MQMSSQNRMRTQTWRMTCAGTCTPTPGHGITEPGHLHVALTKPATLGHVHSRHHQPSAAVGPAQPPGAPRLAHQAGRRQGGHRPAGGVLRLLRAGSAAGSLLVLCGVLVQAQQGGVVCSCSIGQHACGTTAAQSCKSWSDELHPADASRPQSLD